MFENGVGVAKNLRTAIKLYKKAADIGSEEGEENFFRLLSELEQIRDQQARERAAHEQVLRAYRRADKLIENIGK